MVHKAFTPQLENELKAAFTEFETNPCANTLRKAAKVFEGVVAAVHVSRVDEQVLVAMTPNPLKS